MELFNQAARRRSMVLGVVGVAVLAACADSPTPRSLASQISCPPATCGSNTPVVNTFPTHELNLDGKVNRNGISMNPELLLDPEQAEGRCSGATLLSVRDGGFVGVRADGSPVCAGEALLGARFRIGTIAGSVTITIAKLARIELWTPTHATIPAYLLTSDRNGDQAICADPSAWLGPDDAPPATAPGATTEALDPGALGQYAVLIAGEVYDLETATILRDPRWADGTPIDRDRWFNIACQGSALAKMRLLGYDPSADLLVRRISRWLAEARVDERQATLKMITARYCGAISHTEPGLTIGWIQQQLARLWRGPRRQLQWRREVPDDFGAVEARWGRDGALCLSEPRLGTEDADAIRAACEIDRCEPKDRARRAGLPAQRVYWTTRLVPPAPEPVTAAATDTPMR